MKFEISVEELKKEYELLVKILNIKVSFGDYVQIYLMRFVLVFISYLK